jgi:hypothetical protein
MNAWGYIDEHGSWVVRPRFESASSFRDDIAVVSHVAHVLMLHGSTRFGYWKKSGGFLVEPQFESARPFSYGMAAVQMNRLWGFVDQSGAMPIGPQFVEVGAFDRELAPAAVMVEDRGGGGLSIERGSGLWLRTIWGLGSLRRIARR